MKINTLMLSAIGLLVLVVPTVLYARSLAPKAAILVFDRPVGEAVIFNAHGGPHKLRLMEETGSSASGQFSAEELPILLKSIPVPAKNVWIIDLRQESHGFVDGIPVSWYAAQNRGNAELSGEQIFLSERRLLNKLADRGEITVYTVKKLGNGNVEAEHPIKLTAQRVVTEGQLVKAQGAHYKRFFILDHNRPTDEEVDRFVKFIREELNHDSWVHFHCRGGKGRSSTFMAMYDIIKNAKKMEFNDIMQRQLELGNIRFDVVPTVVEKLWKVELTRERYLFLQRFYDYARSDDGFGIQVWSKWSAQQQGS